MHAPHIASHALAHIHAHPATLARTPVHSYGGAARPTSVAPIAPLTSMGARAVVDSYMDLLRILKTIIWALAQHQPGWMTSLCLRAVPPTIEG